MMLIVVCVVVVVVVVVVAVVAVTGSHGELVVIRIAFLLPAIACCASCLVVGWCCYPSAHLTSFYVVYLLPLSRLSRWLY
jgi:hypothetical protein